VKQNSNRASHDKEAARKLWDTSVQVTGVDYAILAPAPARAAS
jgi:hypothetical protein